MSLKMVERALEALDTAQRVVLDSWAHSIGVDSESLVRVINQFDDAATRWANLDRIASTIRQATG
jgi:cell division FtsZ-interacting protein ZapD